VADMSIDYSEMDFGGYVYEGPTDANFLQNIGSVPSGDPAIDAGNSGGNSSGNSSEKWVQQLATLSQALNSFSSPASSLVSGFGLFNNSVSQLTEALSKFPTNIDHTHRITAEVVINGAEAFNGMEDKFKTMMANYVNNAIATSLERNFPDNPKKPTGDNVI
jgi:uncharacterized phage infection (PIP) family protein YhgE